MEEYLLHGKPLANTAESLKNENKSLTQILYEKLLQYPEQQIAAIDAITKKSITYHQILHNGIEIAKMLISLGAVSGDRVMLLCENTIYYQQYLLGSLLAETVLCPTNLIYTIYELDHMCTILQPKIIIACEAPLKNVQELQSKFQFKIIELSTNTSTETTEKHHFASALALPALCKSSNDINLHSPVFILSSSGTTGLPKGVVHSHSSFKGILNILNDSYMNAQDGDVTMGLLPFYHAMGMISLMGNLYCGQKMIVLDKFKPNLFLGAIEEFGVTKALIVPTIGLFLAHYSDIHKYNLTSLKEIISGGATLSSTVLNVIRTKLNVDIRVGYGMSECGFSTLTPPHRFDEAEKRVGSSGVLLPLFTSKIIDAESKESLPAYEMGELCLKSECNFSGYYNNVEETRSSIDSDGFIHSGDLAYYDDAGYIYVVDRLKELIKHKGYQVSPVELECILLKHKRVKDVAVVGVPDEKCGELPRAFVVLKEENRDLKQSKKPENCISEKELQDFVAVYASAYKHLTGGVVFVDEIPKNSAGKILRRKLKEMFITL